ncbi:hypothetical protein LCGC14_0406040 [marine sediment metagenome]|uniref:HNH endonuclease n=1 Tax=marine sediment metagenome TaxID=412755 RepID=A0A0F9SV89_9ZZZZ
MALHPDVNRRNFHKWYQENKGKHYDWRIAYAQENPERHRAQTYAFRGLPAQVCSAGGCEASGERHHEDYSKPLEITWLCKKHHKAKSAKYPLVV